jgi:hypothetical protein
MPDANRIQQLWITPWKRQTCHYDRFWMEHDHSLAWIVPDQVALVPTTGPPRGPGIVPTRDTEDQKEKQTSNICE